MNYHKYSEEDIKHMIESGESSRLEFKEDSVHNDRLAREISAFANFKGGTILLGVSDSGEIIGLTRDDNEERVMNICSLLIEPRLIPEYELMTADDKKIARITIDTGNEKPYAVLSKGRRNYYIRIGSTCRESTQRELMRMFQDSALLHFEALPSAAVLKDLDMFMVFEHFKTYRGIDLEKLDTQELTRILINCAVMNETEQLTVAGCLLFAKRPDRFYAGAGIAFAVIDGNDFADTLVKVAHFNGVLIDNLEKVLDIIRIYNRSRITGLSDKGQRLEDYEYPFKVIREILINALIHRDYSIEGSQVRVFMLKDFFEVRSPGLIPNFLTVEKMKMGVSYYRNPMLMSFFYDRGLIERLGRGIQMIFAEMKKHNNTEPEIFEQGGELVVRIRKKILNSKD
ncbi:Schlafen and ATP-dependent DNA helicase domains-containing protein [Desulfonema limicola]|uniref:Schlafen and ATP-dependent DNA helicase domains-containing protein n=1 Tax=Desulfonema limicola TaxID=45656 RepID=A0A975GFP6_9BACT|nr:RNA-binding domain-containing protein [Desulfonema limicola]QTA79482.1 Schlafen and ATP-dependent DNA helicase domains-containing protein [Desulfonema limicola]